MANLAYALEERHLGPWALLAVVVLAGAALMVLAVHHGHLHNGWRWDNLRIAPVRMAFPFAAGLLLLYRRGIRIRSPGAYWVLSVLLGALRGTLRGGVSIHYGGGGGYLLRGAVGRPVPGGQLSYPL